MPKPAVDIGPVGIWYGMIDTLSAPDAQAVNLAGLFTCVDLLLAVHGCGSGSSGADFPAALK